jgi:acyl transferase domain-containing protein/acyl-CoA synthetase (AMP-forming)/AMP-acid ligase II/surfactin synthase thioesterase subunit
MCVRTLLDLVQLRAAQSAAHTAFIFPEGTGGEEETRLTYAELAHASRSVAAGLQLRTRPGSRVLLLPAFPAGFIPAFYGCIAAGALPVPLPPPRHAGDAQRLERLFRVLHETDATAIVADAPVRALLAEHAHTLPPLLDPGELAAAGPDGWTRPEPDPRDAAYLQFTSGSTAVPRGVVVTHAGALANSALIARAFGHGPESVGFSWLPLYHDMGLLGHGVQMPFAGATSVIASPQWFLRDPLRWPAAISRYGATTSGAPPFAYGLAARRLGRGRAVEMDLSRWMVAYVGAEPVPPRVLEAFSRAFEPFGFTRAAWLPCYGLAEATLLVAGTRSGDGWRARRVDAAALAAGQVREPENGTARVLVGQACLGPEAEVRILEPGTGRPCPEDRVGEICVAGPGVAAGYWNAPQATAETFARDAAGAPLLRTGDLGFVHDGHLYVSGRARDLVIVRGENHYPEDLEHTAGCSHPALEQLPAAAFSVPGPDGEDAVVVQEARRTAEGGALREAAEAVRAAVSRRHGLRAAAVVIVASGDLPRTTSGKVSRHEARAAFLAGALQPLAELRDPAAPEEFAPDKDAVAVIGMACRFAGGADDPEALWSLLVEGRDATCDVPPDRWDVDRFYHPRAAVPGRMNTRRGGFAHGVDRFDAGFFGIAPHEAVEMDPQQRLLLEVAWRAFESAGIPAERLAGSDTGVFVGISNNDYLHLKIRAGAGLEHFNAYSGLGNANSVAANRLSYHFDLRGPSFAVDTACSSSLTALHLAAESLRRGEASLALAGGVNLVLAPGATVTLSQFGMLAPDGHCKVFDASADGYVRSEGCGLVVLKGLADAVRDGDRVLAVVRGSALGQDGRSHGMTAPNGQAQRRVVERALAAARVEPGEVTLVEAHGTGTPLGDPVEVEQLRAVYGAESGSGPCLLGSVKASLGHLESAAGIASVLKVLLALRHGQVPPQLHLRTLNPRISLDGSRLRIPVRPEAWRADGRPRLAAVSSFGFGGALAHLLLQEAPPPPDRPAAAGNPVHLFVLSARGAGALREQARDWAAWLGASADGTVGELAWTRAERRSHLPHRASFVAASRAGLRQALREFAEGGEPGSPAAGAPRVAFLLTGQGAQYAGMARALYEMLPVFREAFDRCAAVVDADREGGPALREVVFAADAGGGLLFDTRYTQPALFAVEYAMARLWMHWGVAPHALLGHSVGEYAAAVLAGCCTPEDGMRLVGARARLMGALPRDGAMAAVFAAESEVRAVLAEHAPDLSVAAVNGPRNVVVSGRAEAVDAALAAFGARGVSCSRVRVSHAFHSDRMDPVLDAFEAAAAAIPWSAPRLPWVSNLTGRVMEGAPDAAYWRRHLRETVRFREGVDHLAGMGTDVFLEVGPGATLASLAAAVLPASDAAFLRSLDRECFDRETALRTLGQLYQRGQPVRWEALFAPGDRRFVPDTPVHPFHRQRYWLDIDYAEALPDAYPERREAAAPRGEADGAPPLPAVFDVRWAEHPPAPDAERRATAGDVHWLLVGDGGALGTALARRLAAARQPVYALVPDPDPRRTSFSRRPAGREGGATRFLVPRRCGADTWFEAVNYVLTHAGRADAADWRIVHLGALASAANEALTVDALERDQDVHGVGDLCALAQAVVRTARVIPLTVVTRGAQAVVRDGEDDGAESPSLAQAPVWGFARTLFLEHPEMRGGVVDLDPAGEAESDAARVIAQAGAPGGEAQVAFRGGARLVAQLVPAAEPPAERVPVRGDGVYLVTGGLGGLGLRCARWLAERGARHLVLAGRRVPPARAAWEGLEGDAARQVAGIRQIEALGATVQVEAADVGDPGQLDALFARMRAGGLPLRGVVHAAGVNWFGKVRGLERAALLDALKVKVTAAWRLHELTRGDDLDLFLLFSSVSALWGSVDLSHYTASNQFLDALAHHRRAAGLPALSLDWGPWAEVGMSAKAHETEVLGRLGFTLLAPERAIGVMERLAAGGRAQAVVADVDWASFRTFVDFSGSPSLFARVAAEGGEGGDAPRLRNAAERIRSLPPGEAREALLALARQQLSSVMLLQNPGAVDVNQRFNFLGMDSLMAIAFAARLENLLELKLPTTLAYNYPTLQAVADHLYEQIRGEAPPPEGSGSPPAAGAPAEEGADRWFSVLFSCPRPERRLFCFPYAGGGAAAYARWGEAAGPGTELVAVCLPGRDQRAGEPPLREMRELVEGLADALASRCELPFAFYGHSLGALVAFELARELRRRGMPAPEALVVSGCGAPGRGGGRLHLQPDDAFVRELEEAFGVPGQALRDPGMAASLLPVLRADIALLETYAPAAEPPLAIPLLALGGTEDPLAPPQSVSAWRAQAAGPFRQRSFAGGHMFPWEAAAGVHDEVRAWTAASHPVLEPA